jgi:hypothetical protein
LNNKNAERPHRRIALVARDLGRYNVDIAALSETRLLRKASSPKLELVTPSGVDGSLRNIARFE